MRALLLPALATLALVSLPAAYAADCATLATQTLPDTTITEAVSVTGGAITPPYGGTFDKLPAFCRITGVLHPTSDSHILFEVWLPETGWNHKLLGTGNGGFAGTIYYQQMAGNLRRGYATFGTDTGHQADAQDASWAYKHPEKIIDFGSRGLHLTTQRARSLVTAYYGGPAAKAYFDGCSDGGREALMEAQRFPDDFDGILAGAPANDWTHLVAGFLEPTRMIGANPAAYISSYKLPAITAAVLAACDQNDGVKDGVLNDPRECRFDPASMLCKDGDALTCLTAPQVSWLKRLYSGSAIFPGFMPGDEGGSWKSWVVGDAPGSNNYGQNFFRYMVLSDPTWNAMTADPAAAVKAADATMGPVLNANDPDLSKFAAHGGKLILYHGWNDPAISPLSTIGYYDKVASAMGAEKEQGFVRLYMVPGMEHCTGGPGPSAFGQFGLPTAKGPTYGLFSALEDWEENGKPPAEVIATKYGMDQKVQLTRPLCPYPQSAKYNGTGDQSDAASFACAGPAR